MTNLTMHNFSSISLANTKVKFTLFSLAFALALVLYWPGMNGSPIWDDITYWFFDPVMLPKFPYIEIWKNFTWPLSVSAQKLIYSFAASHWWVYHGINFSLHCFNSWLLYRFLLQLRVRRSFAFYGFLFFLLQPASVVTVAWMIQFKTLICFSFALGAIIFFMKIRRKRDVILPSLLFFFSVICKSSSLPLPIVLIFLLGRNWKTKKILYVFPFILISIFALYRISHSKLTMEGIENAAKVATKVIEDTPVELVLPQGQPTSESKGKLTAITPPSDEISHVFTDEYFGDEITTEVEETASEESIKEEPNLYLEKLAPYLAYANLILKTLYYYFWQAYLPVDTSPVKGLNPSPPDFQVYLHLLFLLLILFLTWGTPLLSAFLSAHAFLLLYLGLIPAPYMNVTWVSDQHLYLALPCFILLLMGPLEKIKNLWVFFPLSLVLIFFAYKTNQSSKYYKDSISFYEQSIDSNFNNVPLVYNLSVIYIASGQTSKAHFLLESMIRLGLKDKHIEENTHFPLVVQLYSTLQNPEGKK